MKRFLSLFVLLAASTAAPAQQAPPPAAVEIAPVELKRLTPTATVSGQVQARAAADLAAGVAGTLAWIAEPGARVARNQLLARLDTDELELQRQEQQARALRGEINLRQSARELERLRASGLAVSRYQLDQAEGARDLAQADLDIARAALRQTEERLARAELRAPFAGVLAERLKRAGEEVNRGEPLARLLGTDELEIRLFLPLRHVRAVKPGDRVTVKHAGRSLTARLRTLVPAGDARSQSFEARVDLPPQEAALPAGSVVEVELPLGAPQALIAVPRDALIIRAEGMAVYRVGADKLAQRVAVKPGVADGDWIAVDGALAAADQVVVRGGESLHHGQALNIIGQRSAWTTKSSSPLSAP